MSAAGRTSTAVIQPALLDVGERAPFHAEHPAYIYPLAKRPSFTGEGTDSAAYAWWVWGPGRGGRWFAPLLPGGASC